MGPLLSTWFNFKNDMLDAKVLLGNKVLPKPMLTKFQGLEMSEGADELNSYNKEIFKGTKLSVWWSPTSRQSGQWCRNPSHGVSSSQFNGWLNMKVYLLIYLISIDLVLILLAAWQKMSFRSPKNHHGDISWELNTICHLRRKALKVFQYKDCFQL